MIQSTWYDLLGVGIVGGILLPVAVLRIIRAIDSRLDYSNDPLGLFVGLLSGVKIIVRIYLVLGIWATLIVAVGLITG